MDNSQRSEVFTEFDVELNSACDPDFFTYEELLSELKESLSFDPSSKNESTKFFADILEACSKCISQTFDIIVKLIEKSADGTKLSGLLQNAITILRLLSDYLNNLVKSIPITCCSMKSFPIATGNIILSIFKHCKDSECLYGVYLKCAEKELKDLFRTCHDLQVLYLMIFEKHYVIDLDVITEQEVLLASLDIYLQICDVTQDLDVKTMAEQWKAYSVVCEKYASYLLDTQVFSECIEHVMATVKSNMILEPTEEDKVVVRSLKVASFVIKILCKLSNVFKNTHYKYGKAVELFLFILPYKNELNPRKYPKHTSLIDNLILLPAYNLLTVLANEEFLNYIINKCMLEVEDNLSYILLLVSTMEIVAHSTNKSNGIKERLTKCVFAALPYCHNLFITPSRFKLNDNKCCQLYEYLLMYVVMFTRSFDSREYTELEGHILETLLCTDCGSAMFVSDLWVILCRNNDQLQFNTLTSLIKIYQKLEANDTFQTSPQRHHLLHTIENLFRTLPYDDKILVYRQFNVQDFKNSSLWCMMMPALPDNIRVTAENILRERCLRYIKDFLLLKKMRISDLHVAIQHTKLISKCTGANNQDLKDMEGALVECWMKCCPKTEFIKNELSANMWYIGYIEALTAWTHNFVTKIQDSSLSKILHVVTAIITVGNIEVTIILFELFCKLLWQMEGEDYIVNGNYNILSEIFLKIGKEDQEYLFVICMSDASLNKFLSHFFSNDKIMKEVHNNYESFKNNHLNYKSTQPLSMYIHKCLNSVKIKSTKCNNSENNHIVPEETTSSECGQPSSKKAKIEASTIEELLVQFETNSSQIYQDRDMLTLDQKTRIKNVCNKLITI